MARNKPKRETFADTVARVSAQPRREEMAPTGRHGLYWGDRDHRKYELVTHDLGPLEALQLVQEGASVVYDQCGCGGSECELDWLSTEDLAQLAVAGPPVLHPGKHGLAELELWRSESGYSLVVAAVAVTWGDRISG